MPQFCFLICLAEEIEKLKEEKVKAEDIKERALAFVKDKEREFSTQQRQYESELGLVKQQLKHHMEQLHSSDTVDESASVVKIR